MQISVTFRHIGATEPLKKHATDKVEHLRKYLDDSAHVHVVLSTEKLVHRADIQVASHGMMMRGKEDSNDLYYSIDRAVEKLETQIKRYKDRLVSHKPRAGTMRKIKFNTLAQQEYPANEMPANIIETKEVEARPMMLDEACMQMDLLGSELLVFLNVKTEHLNIIYRKKGQKYGLIEAT